MKPLIFTVAALALVFSSAASAQRDIRWDDRQDDSYRRDGNPPDDNRRYDDRRDDDDDRGWSDGDRRPRIDPRDHRRSDGDDREQLWRQHYARAYVYEDDPAYTECRHSADPAGVLAGAFLGGILGNAAGHGDGGATAAGVIAGGAVGLALTQHLDCDDRSYAYKTYSEGFNAGRRDAYYEWRNPNGKHHGRFHVVDYYHDEDGFHCAVYEHTAFIDGRRESAHGRACQQPNGSWAIID